MAVQDEAETAVRACDVLAVGAGFSGLYLLHRLRGLGFDVAVVEKGEDVGGTWYWNRYPGARCDIESLQYSFSFDEDLQQEWSWPERYSAQEDILRYARHVAERFDLRRDIRFGTAVTAAHWDEAAGLWRIDTDRGDSYRARFFVMATGCLSVPRVPEIPGQDDFKGRSFVTGRWPHEPVDFSGERVALIGTGSTAIQLLPYLAEEAAQVTVFQRTPNFSVPGWNRPMDPAEEARVKADYPALRAAARRSGGGFVTEPKVGNYSDLDPVAAEAEMERRWAIGGFEMEVAFEDTLLSETANQAVAGFVHRKIRETVADPATADALCPRDHPLGSKRLCIDHGYYECFNRDAVSLVDLKETPISRIAEKAVETAAGVYPCESIVYATGFDAMTGAVLAVDIRGRGGLTIQEKWAEGPRSYLGLTVAGFPNFFTITGPGSPSVLTNMMTAIEQHVVFVSECLAALRDRQQRRIEPTEEAEEAWVARVREAAEATLYPQANSWYMGANVPGKPRLFFPYVGGMDVYADHCARVAVEGYAGFSVI